MEADKLTTELCKMLQLFLKAESNERQNHILQLLSPKARNTENLKYQMLKQYETFQSYWELRDQRTTHPQIDAACFYVKL